MNGRLWAVALFCAAAGASLAPAASAVTMTSVQMPAGQGVSGPAVIAPINLGGSTLSGGLGTLETKGVLSNLPGVPNLTPGVLPRSLPSLGLPGARTSFRPDVELPGLPASVIPGAAAHDAASQLGLGAAAPAVGANAVETVADFGLYGGAPAPIAAQEDLLKPGPGGGLSMLQRQSLRIGAKADSVTTQLRAAGEAKGPSDESALGLGRRVMEVLTEGRGYEGGEAKTPAAGGRTDAVAVRTQAGYSVAGVLAPHSEASAAYGETAGIADQFPGKSLAELQDAGVASPAAAVGGYAPAGLKAGVALIALRVYDASLVISVVGVPARRLALRLTQDSALAWEDSPESRDSSVAQTERQTLDMRDAVASPTPAAPAGGLTRAAPTTSAESEAFAFLQSQGGDSQPELKGQPSPGGESGPGRGLGRAGTAPAPVNPADALLAASLLPFVGLGLFLRSRFYS